MGKFVFNQKTYEVDDLGFLVDYLRWDENFVEGMARSCGMADGPTEKHWQVIRFIRRRFEETGECPVVFAACKSNQLQLREMKRLFPTGYMRGACKIAGITYDDRRKDFHGEESALAGTAGLEAARAAKKTYRVNAMGFLMDASEWDELFAVHKARELGMEGGLRDGHWRVIRFLRDAYQKKGEVPTVYDTCEALDIELDGLERLFPTGYHRGAVKIAGLRAR